MAITKRSYKVYNDKKMVDILTEKHTFNRCHYCGPPQGKVIMPNDKFQRKTAKGDYMCGVCALEVNRKILDGMNRRISPS